MRLLAALALLGLLAAACSVEVESDAGPVESAEIADSVTDPVTDTVDPELVGTRWGFALSPRSYTDPDFPDFLALIDGEADVLAHVGDWIDLAEPNNPFVVLDALAEGQGMETLMVISPSSAESLVRPLDEATRASYLADLRAYLAEQQPEYLGLGNEVNMVLTDHPDDFDAIVSLLEEATAVVRELSPDTEVFVVLQYEWLIGERGGWFGRGRAPADWQVIDRFDFVDAIAFTTYPSLVFDDPSELAEDYYARIADHADRPVFFTEVGWTAEPLPVLPGSEDEQARYVERFGELTSSLDLAVAVWPFVFSDLIEHAAFQGTGLMRSDGTPRPAWDAWQELRAG